MANEFIARNGLIAQNNSTVTGSLIVTQGITGSLLGTASYATQALTASYASTYAPVFPYTGSAIITGSLEVTGSILATTDITTPQITGVSGVNGITIITNNTASGSIAKGVNHTPTLVATTNNDIVVGLDIVPVYTNGVFTGVRNLDLRTSNFAVGKGIDAYTAYSSLWLGQSAPSNTNFVLRQFTTTAMINGPTGGTLQFAQGSISYGTLSNTSWTFSNPTVGSGAFTAFTFNPSANTNQTLSTNIPNFRITGANKQWATGTVANQYWNYLTSNTASFVGASTMTNSYGLYVEEATAGTNATITNNYAAGFSGSISLEGGNRSINCSNALTIKSGFGTGLALYGGQGGNILLGNNGISNLTMWASQTSGVLIPITFFPSVSTNQTLSTNIPNFRVTGANKQWATGTLANQYFNYFTANTASFVGASTATNVYGLFAEAAIAGTNATITNNWGIGTTGDIQVGGTGTQIVFSTATNAYVRNTGGNLRLSCGAGARVAIDADGSLVGSFTSALSSITTTTLNLSGITTIAGDTTINSAVGSSLTLTSGARNAGVRTLFTLTGSSDTNQTTSTEVNRVLWTMGSKTWATGNITNQREFLITSPTYNFNGASTITNAYGLYVNAPTAGTNATITNNYAAGFSGSVQIKAESIPGQGIVIRNLVGSTTNSAIYMGVSPSSTNYAIRADASGNNFINGGQLFLCVGGTSQVVMNGASIAFQSNNIQSSGATIQYQFSPVTNTGQTASTEIPLFNINSATTTWLTGNITTQRNIWFKTRTLNFGGASTVTSSYGLYVEAATAGALATITNNYAAGFSGSVQILTGGLNVTGSVNASSFTGSLLGTATSASYVLQAVSSSFSSTASYVNPLNQTITATGSLNLSGSITITSGSITMPDRPAFRVTGAGGGKTAVTVLSGSYLNVDYQQGSGWNNSTGTFTAPIAGLYQVNLVVRTNSNSLGTISQLIVFKNNTSGTNGTQQIMVEFGSNTTMNHAGGSTISKLEVGDTLKMVVAAGEISFDVNDNFSVAYIG